MIFGQHDFFSRNLGRRIFFSLLNALHVIFFLSLFLCRIFFPSKKYPAYMTLQKPYISIENNYVKMLIYVLTNKEA